MKTYSMNLSLEGLDLGSEKKTPEQWFASVVESLFEGYMQAIQKGLSEKERRQYYKIMDAIEDSSKKCLREFSLEDSESEFLKKVVSQALMRPAKLVRRVEELLSTESA